MQVETSVCLHLTRRICHGGKRRLAEGTACSNGRFLPRSTGACGLLCGGRWRHLGRHLRRSSIMYSPLLRSLRLVQFTSDIHLLGHAKKNATLSGTIWIMEQGSAGTGSSKVLLHSHSKYAQYKNAAYVYTTVRLSTQTLPFLRHT